MWEPNFSWRKQSLVWVANFLDLVHLEHLQWLESICGNQTYFLAWYIVILPIFGKIVPIVPCHSLAKLVCNCWITPTSQPQNHTQSSSLEKWQGPCHFLACSCRGEKWHGSQFLSLAGSLAPRQRCSQISISHVGRNTTNLVIRNRKIRWPFLRTCWAPQKLINRPDLSQALNLYKQLANVVEGQLVR